MSNRQSTSGNKDAINRLRFIENTNNKSEVPSTKKETPIEQQLDIGLKYIFIESKTQWA